MIYLENIFICVAAPLVIAVFILRGETRRFAGFFLLGLAACLLSAYVNSFFAAVLVGQGYARLTVAETMVQITPICEEVMKALPVLFFLAVAAPRPRAILSAAVAVGLGFATLENCAYLMQYGAGDIWFSLLRGFSAGVLHAVCAAVLGFGLAFVYRRRRMAVPAGFALLCTVITFHAVFNLLVAANGAWRMAGYLLPAAAAVAVLLLVKLPRPARSRR